MAIEREPPYTELVAAAAKAINASSPRKLADAIGYTGRDEDKTVRNWWNGVNAPSYEPTMKLLALAGWLNEDRVAASLDAAQAAAEEAERLARDVPGQQPQEEQETG